MCPPGKSYRPREPAGYELPEAAAQHDGEAAEDEKAFTVQAVVISILIGLSSVSGYAIALVWPLGVPGYKLGCDCA